MYKITLIFFLITLCKLSPVECTLDCTEDHPENCETGEIEDPDWDPNSDIARSSRITRPIVHNTKGVHIPKSFDARIKWPKCKSISRIKSQGTCKNCWSFCSSMVLADRVCIASGGRDQVDFSVSDLSSCCRNCYKRPHRLSCALGGFINRAFEFLVNFGITFETCKPYSFFLRNSSIIKCEKKCVDRGKKYSSHKAAGVRFAANYPDPKQIQIEIMKNGPVCGYIENLTIEFIKWRDQHGVFSPTQRAPMSSKEGGISVRIIGWGTQHGIDYWLCANNWGTSWGAKGFFKIARSRELNICGITKRFWTIKSGPLKKEDDGKSRAEDLSVARSLVLGTTIYLLMRCF